MINLPCGETSIGIYHMIFDPSGVRIPFSSFPLEVVKYYKVHLSQLLPLGFNKGDWFSFAKRRGSVPVCMEDTRHPDSCVADDLPIAIDQGYVDRLSAHIIKLRTISEGVLAQFGISKVWCNPLCDPVIRRPDDTVISIYDFIYMPSLGGTKVREEPHDLGIPLLERVADHTTTPAPPEIVVLAATLKEIVVTQPDRGVVTKAKNTTKQKASTRPEVSTKKTKVGKKNSRVGSGNGLEQADDGTLDDDAQGTRLHVTYPPTILLDKEVFAATNIKSSECMRRDTRTHSLMSHGTNGDTHHRVEADAQVFDTSRDAHVSHVTKPKDTEFCVDEPRDTEHLKDGYIGFDGGSSESPPPYTKEEWDGVHTMNLGLINKEFFKDLKVCKTTIERFPTPAEVLRIETLSQEELTGRGLRMDHSDTEFEKISRRVANFLEPGPIVPPSKASSATVSLGAGTHDHSSTLSTEAFSHTSTPEHLKRKKPYGSGASLEV
nr:hypothetical protein [Tanacetum cinerariifolium]